IAGTQFTLSAGRPVGPVAAWDGESWRSLGVPASGLVANLNVHALVVVGQSLVAGGDFDRMGAVVASRIARWDGNAWTAIGAGFDDRVETLGLFRGELIAAGAFTHSGSSAVPHVARWNGSTWSSVGPGIPSDEFVHIHALAELRDTLYAGGVFVGLTPEGE